MESVSIKNPYTNKVIREVRLYAGDESKYKEFCHISEVVKGINKNDSSEIGWRGLDKQVTFDINPTADKTLKFTFILSPTVENNGKHNAKIIYTEGYKVDVVENRGKYNKFNKYYYGIDNTEFTVDSFDEDKNKYTLKFVYYDNNIYVDMNSVKNVMLRDDYFEDMTFDSSNSMYNFVVYEDTNNDTKFYVTESQLQAFGWKNTSEQEVSDLNDMLQKYGITSEKSIKLFLATCGHESGKGIIALEKLNYDGTTVGDYDKNQRGAGYIQITWRGTHLKFLNTVNDSFNGADTATYIAQNYPWEAAGWFWSSKDAKTAGGISLNDYVVENGDSKGVFLVTQYLINGWPSALENDTALSIRDGKVSWKTERGRLIVDGKDICRVPIGWDDREKNYNDAINAFK